MTTDPITRPRGHPIAGALLAASLLAGLPAVHALGAGRWPTVGLVWADMRLFWPTYAYLTLVSAALAVVLGRRFGFQLDRARQGTGDAALRRPKSADDCRSLVVPAAPRSARARGLTLSQGAHALRADTSPGCLP